MITICVELQKSTEKNIIFLNEHFKHIKYFNGTIYLMNLELNLAKKIKDILILYKITCIIREFNKKYFLVVREKYT